jgi:hypothetical protein
MRIMNIMGTNGNVIEPRLVDVPSTNEVAAKLEQQAYAVTRTRVVMKFESTGTLPVNASASDFILRAGTSTPIPLKPMSFSSIDSAKREIIFDLVDGYEMNSNGTYGASGLPLSVTMLVPGSVTLTKTALGTPLEIKDGVSANVIDNIKPGLLEAIRGACPAQASSLITGVAYPALTRDQVLIVLDERVRLVNITHPDQLGWMLDVRLGNQPGSSLVASAFTVEAFNESGANSTLSATVETRMLLVSLKSSTGDAASVTVRPNYLWDGNMDANGQNVMNAEIQTGYMAPY